MASKLKNAAIGAGLALASALGYADKGETHITAGTNYGLKDHSIGVNMGFLSPITEDLKLGASVIGYSNLANPIAWGVNVHDMLSVGDEFVDFRSGLGAMLQAQHTIKNGRRTGIKSVAGLGVGFSLDHNHNSGEVNSYPDVQASLGLEFPNEKRNTAVQGVLGYNQRRGPYVGVSLNAERK